MRRINLFIPLLAIALHAACAQAGQCMGSLAEVEAFLSDVTPRTDRFEVEAKVLNVAIASDSAQIILSDGHGVRVELCRDAAASQPAPGDTIRATGKEACRRRWSRSCKSTTWRSFATGRLRSLCT